MSLLQRILVVAALLSTCACTASGGPPKGPLARFRGSDAAESLDSKGWSYLASRLAADGIEREELQRIYMDPRMPPFKEVSFKLAPKESPRSYNGFYSRDKIALARRFMVQFREPLNRAVERYGVDREVVAAILLIETEFGRNTGTELVINRLSRVASIGEPSNLQWNFEQLKKEDPTVTLEQVRARAAYLEELFYPELPALFSMLQRSGADVFDLKGSRAGAFGIPQFLPSSYLKYAVDGNGDGAVSLFDESDAILSTASFLARSGWRSTDIRAKRKALWSYNRSDAYVDAVLKVASLCREHARVNTNRNVRNAMTDTSNGERSSPNFSRSSLRSP